MKQKMDLEILKYIALPLALGIAFTPLLINNHRNLIRAEREAVQIVKHDDYFNSWQYFAFDRNKDGEIEEILETRSNRFRRHMKGEYQFNQIMNKYFPK